MIIIYVSVCVLIVYSLDLIIFSNLGIAFIFPPKKIIQIKTEFSFEIFVPFDICFSQLAEALFEYGRGNEKQALELLGPDFDANNCKVWSSSTDQCAPKCSQFFHLS